VVLGAVRTAARTCSTNCHLHQYGIMVMPIYHPVFEATRDGSDDV
jgi:hypothetical protein